MRKLSFAHYVRPGDAYHVSRSRILDEKPFPLHTHDYVEVFWIENGDGFHLINGGTVPISKRHMVFIRPGDVHAFRAAKGPGMLVANIAFPVDTLEYVRSRYASPGHDYWDPLPALPAVAQVSALELEWLKHEADWMSHGARSRLDIDRFLLGVMSKLEHHAPPSPGEGVPPWLAKALTAIKEPENFHGGTLRLAQLAGRSPEHVARIIRATLNVRPIDLVNRARMEYAAQRLAMSDDDIQDLGLNCGFESLGHFYQCFQKEFGTSPRRYRLRQRGVLGMDPAKDGFAKQARR